MARGWSGRKLLWATQNTRLVKISILFGLIFGCLWCCLGVPGGAVCVRASGESGVAVRGGSIVSLQSLALQWWQQLCLPLVSSNSLARVTPALPLPESSGGVQSWDTRQLVNSSQKYRSREIGTIHSPLQHFCLLSAPQTRPPRALREGDTASVHNAPFTVKHAAVAPHHLQNLLKEADKLSGARG